MRRNTLLRLQIAVWMTATAFVGIFFFHTFGTMWSNHCDPGNAQFNLLKNDPMVTSHPDGGLMFWESNRADNSWLCTYPTLTLSYTGLDHNALLAQVNAKMVDSGWTLIPVPVIKGVDLKVLDGWTEYEKQTPGGVHLQANVQSQYFGAEVDMKAPGLHLGDPGW